MQVRRIIQNALLTSVIALTMALTCSGCKKKEAPPVPTVRAERLLEILRLFDMGNYEAVIPKIEQYQELDETNTFLVEMHHIAITNAVIVKAEDLLRQGKAKEASECIQNAITKYGDLDGLVQAKNAFLTAQHLQEQIRMLKKPLTSDILTAKATELEKRANELGSKNIAVFAARKKADAPVIRLIEYDRAGFLIYADAMDSIRQNKSSNTLSLIALLEHDRQFAENGKRLRDEGIYSMHGIPDKKQVTGGVSNPKNKTINKK